MKLSTKNLITFLAVIALSVSAYAETIALSKTKGDSVKKIATRDKRSLQIQFHLNELSRENVILSKASKKFDQVKVDELPLSNDLGAPRLPFYGLTVAAAPSEIVVSANLGASVKIRKLDIEPAQEEDCRCDDAKNTSKTFQNKVSEYRTPQGNYSLQQLGDFRGTPVTRILFYPHRYLARTQTLSVYPNASFHVSIKGSMKAQAVFDLSQQIDQAARDKTYLVVVPSSLSSSISSWVDFKTSLGFSVRVLELSGALTAAQVGQAIKAEYDKSAFSYAMLVGSQRIMPANSVSTSSSSATPSDLNYFTYGGATDIIPDVFAGRMVVDNADQVTRITKKWMAYENDSFGTSQGWRRMLGIASNEGQSPSDNEYVTAIESKLKKTYDTEIKHFYQNDSNSNPTQFNQEMNVGSMWVTYLGHGSGTSWPSFKQQYSVSNIAQMKNESAVKPIWIDVACQNGNLNTSNAGAVLQHQAASNGDALGTTAFYGGTVNISWHPPAILARGIVFKMAERTEPQTLGAAIQQGHIYLAESNSKPTDLSDNQRWYVLQGDPSLTVRSK